MNRREKTAKKIVSKGQYVRRQLKRAVTLMTGCMALLFAAIWALTFFLSCLAELLNPHRPHMDAFSFIAVLVVCTVIAGGGMLLLGAVGSTLVKHSADMNDVVPFTKTTVSDVPMQESLVRASEEPPVAAETILLRAATETITTPPEQLVRPSATPE